MKVLRAARGLASRHPAVTGIAATVLVAGLVGGFLWFRPDKLFVDEVVDEAFPLVSPTSEPVSPTPGSGSVEEPTEPAEPMLLASGSFVSHNRYTTSGDARVFQLEDGSRALRFQDFSTSNGPDLLVYLSAAPPGTSDRSLADDFVDLGALKGNVGNQNYEIPAGVDLDRYSTVVIWCRRFTVSFGGAVLEA